MKKYIALSLVLLFVFACSDGDELGDVTMSKDFISVSQGLELSGDGGSEELEIKATCSWTISKNADWLTISTQSGEKNGKVTLTAGKNTTGAVRTATLTVKGGTNLTRTVTITQGKASAQLPGSGDNVPPETD